MQRKNQVVFYYLFLILTLAALASVIFLLYFVLIRKLDWYLFAIVILVYFFNLIFNLYLLLQQRNFEAKISWIAIFSIIPFIGSFLYVIYGRRYINRKNSKHFFQEYKNFTKQENLQIPNIEVENDKKFLLEYAQNKFNSPIRSFNSEIIVDGFKFFELFFNAIRNAKKFIFIDTFIIKNDFIWKELKQILIQKSLEGVEVKIIVDSLGVYFIKNREWKDLKSNKVEILFYNIIKFPFLSGNKLYRNHRKVYLIDGEMVFTGGNNISEEYIGFNKKFGYWVDLNMKLEGSIVQSYTQNFLFSWNKWSSKKQQFVYKKEEYLATVPINEDSKDSKNYGVVLQSGPVTEESIIEGFILKQIYSARKKIQLFTPYFAPSQKIIDALSDVLLAGIEVEIYIPGKNDKSFFIYFNSYFAKMLKEKGAKIYIFKKLFYHSKSIIIDEKIGIMGTLNLDLRSLFSQFEISLLLTGPGINTYLEYIQDMKNKKIVVEKQNYIKINLFFKMLIHLFKPIV
ncbi:phospholipase D-like domain-containing protein [Mesomycoplasma conjunctivae]|uniref:phospholipase D-like domain-containing protein n=1 Tax=Mesomycoplasma conjunctivae TaxID=45361 RepID=UPI003DA40E20